MANLREIRRRISGVKSTSKITQAMKLVAAAKLRRAQDAIISARPYAFSLRDLLVHLLSRVDRNTLPLMMERSEVDNVLLVVVTADRGLCGAFNTNIVKAAQQRIETEYAEKHAEGKLKLICIGRRGFNHFNKRGFNIIGKHVGMINDATFQDAKAIMDGIVQGYLQGDFDRVEVVYNEFKSVITQKLQIEQFLPLPEEQIVGEKESRYIQFVDYIYEPSEVDLMEMLIPKHLVFQLFRVFLESNAAEQGARMTAMDSATTNARDLIHALQLVYNRARQASITTEILEIVGGAEALKQQG